MYYIDYGNETVVYSRGGKRLIATPTEQEAMEWIAENGGQTY